MDNDAAATEFLGLLLEQRGFAVTTALTAEEGMRTAYRTQPDLVLLDLLPNMDGREVCRKLRDLSDVPIIFLTAYGDKPEVVKGLEMGADNYVLKPFDNSELIARIKALIRRLPASAGVEGLVFDQGQFRINFAKRELSLAHVPIHLAQKEFDLLGVVVRHTDQIVTHLHLVKEPWGLDYMDTVNNLKLYVHYLRQKIEKDPQRPRYILISRSIGYRFKTY